MKISDFLSELKSRNSFLFSTGMIHFILFFIFLLLSLIDHRTVHGLNTWYKPMKFAMSIGLYVWSMGWFMAYLKMAPMFRKIVSLGIGISMIIEMVCIMYQGARAVPSHFNGETQFDHIIFSLMGIMIIVNCIWIFIVFALLLIQRPPINFNYLLSIRLGFVIFIMANVVGGLMIKFGTPTIGEVDTNAGLPFLNWATDGGDLRVSHFIGLHALQILPIACYLLQTYTRLSGRSVFLITMLIFLFYAFIFSGTYFQALSGHPMLQF